MIRWSCSKTRGKKGVPITRMSVNLQEECTHGQPWVQDENRRPRHHPCDQPTWSSVYKYLRKKKKSPPRNTQRGIFILLLPRKKGHSTHSFNAILSSSFIVFTHPNIQIGLNDGKNFRLYHRYESTQHFIGGSNDKFDKTHLRAGNFGCISIAIG